MSATAPCGVCRNVGDIQRTSNVSLGCLAIGIRRARHAPVAPHGGLEIHSTHTLHLPPQQRGPGFGRARKRRPAHTQSAARSRSAHARDVQTHPSRSANPSESPIRVALRVCARHAACLRRPRRHACAAPRQARAGPAARVAGGSVGRRRPATWDASLASSRAHP
jgi:hypothetical protein